MARSAPLTLFLAGDVMAGRGIDQVLPHPSAPELCETAKRAHMDVVHGHSSHHPKAVEVHRDRVVLYGCGDFLNDYEDIPPATDAASLGRTMDRECRRYGRQVLVRDGTLVLGS